MSNRKIKENVNKYINSILNDSFQIPKEKIINCQDEKDNKSNIIYSSFSNLPTSITSNSNINNNYIRKRPNIIQMSNKKRKKKNYKKVTFNDDNLVEYININSYKKFNYTKKKYKEIYKKELHPHCNCTIF